MTRERVAYPAFGQRFAVLTVSELNRGFGELWESGDGQVFLVPLFCDESLIDLMRPASHRTQRCEERDGDREMRGAPKSGGQQHRQHSTESAQCTW